MASELVVLVDLNIVLDILAQREPHYASSGQVWAAIETERATGWLAAHAKTTLHYLLVRHTDHRRAVAALRDLLRVFSVAPVDEQVLQNALDLGWRDFKDAVQMASAAAAGADFLVTRNPKDFKGGPIPTLQPSEMLALIRPR